ncbi:MAG TPA: hypothetical protein DEG28_08955 [Porphyromonadaceae bacterium]|nr:hypothetical protein [Porphyromonadaceae bacterium]
MLYISYYWKGNHPNSSIAKFIYEHNNTIRNMSYKIGDKFDVIIPGFSPTVARIDNITDKEDIRYYHISFQEEHFYTICRTVTERQLEEMIDTYDRNKDNLEPFMMKKDGGQPGDLPSHDENLPGGVTKIGLTSDARDPF